MGSNDNNSLGDKDNSKLQESLDLAYEKYANTRTNLMASNARFTTAQVSLQHKIQELGDTYATGGSEIAINAKEELANKLQEINKKIDSLDVKDVSTDLEQSDLEIKKKELFINYTNTIKTILPSEKIPSKDKEICSSLEYDRRLAMLDHIAFTNLHKDSIRELVNAEQAFPEETDSSCSSSQSVSPKKSSLLDDFADPSLEQPSYMDPED